MTKPRHACEATPLLERVVGVVERVTFHSEATGWSVLKVAPFDKPGARVTVTVHQVAVFAGATMEFVGAWGMHPKYGEQFRCERAVERKPATAAGLERYLGSGLIRGVGPKTARKIVAHFGDQTLDVFESKIDRLTEVQGIAGRKLRAIAGSWREHRAIRDVMIFLQRHGISTLFAVRIYKRYAERAIAQVEADPYRLSRDIYGIGFFSADRIASALGFAADGRPRVEAGIRHVLAASRDFGDCYLLAEQVRSRTVELLACDDTDRLGAFVDELVCELARRGEVKVREWTKVTGEASDSGKASEPSASPVTAYYSRTLYLHEQGVAEQLARRAGGSVRVDPGRVDRWLTAYASRAKIVLSNEQCDAIRGMVSQRFAILTGGPGCGKTTTLRALVMLLGAMGHRLVLAAPTGRAAQRMSQVIGVEARTLHRVLEWDPTRDGFKRDEHNPVQADVIVVDEASMLDVSIAFFLFQAARPEAQVLFIGDPDQLPAVGPGNVLADLLAVPRVPRFTLTEVFRQASSSQIVSYAHGMRRGEVP
ncbi:MAG: AAA family ATPase, partial [Nannocystaceae bacterium]